MLFLLLCFSHQAASLPHSVDCTRISHVYIEQVVFLLFFRHHSWVFSLDAAVIAAVASLQCRHERQLRRRKSLQHDQHTWYVTKPRYSSKSVCCDICELSQVVRAASEWLANLWIFLYNHCYLCGKTDNCSGIKKRWTKIGFGFFLGRKSSEITPRFVRLWVPWKTLRLHLIYKWSHFLLLIPKERGIEDVAGLKSFTSLRFFDNFTVFWVLWYCALTQIWYRVSPKSDNFNRKLCRISLRNWTNFICISRTSSARCSYVAQLEEK